MPSASYEKNKKNILDWRERNPDVWARAHNRQNKTYYEKNKARLQKYYREKATYNRGAKIFRQILMT